MKDMEQCIPKSQKRRDTQEQDQWMVHIRVEPAKELTVVSQIRLNNVELMALRIVAQEKVMVEDSAIKSAMLNLIPILHQLLFP